MASRNVHDTTSGALAAVSRFPFILPLVLLAAIVVSLGNARVARAGDALEVEIAGSIHVYETEAYQDYEFRTTSERVLRRSDELWKRHVELAQSGRSPQCAEALRLLSMMVQESYFASRRGEVPFDWFAMAPTYLELRKGCYSSLNVDVAEYGLPSAFAR
ncbi:MAG: hypothetical protein NW205_10160 [Hyphomicrobiaceae bacterium]|nr:hypothetical protein [Hyphomicrobiaceae bacterium]